ncbi:MAG: hypothetical protein AVDCRST_MAG50-163 [uncultured Acidimicrobiales bacterium]|uniref:TesB-like acyl-CoA thioesterase 3 n=1 Tax=uncultured Acidimicrobiales bacterium TaxID=310071 RepID=A0A6J4H4I9_9ACTN|nr:MAG: hypothetical protein AVDCRST_MAG50-163 [uncultured Acidimicrobiales bacterium]
MDEQGSKHDDRRIVGPWRRPKNLSADAAGSIHDEGTATALGLRGGTVAGNIHMDQLPPLLVEAFGAGWFETGSMSLYFRHATTDLEEVQAWVERPVDGALQVACGMTARTGEVVCEGTASVGAPSEPTALEARDKRSVDPSTLRILRDLHEGQHLPGRTMIADGAGQRRRLAAGVVTEPLDWYDGSSPWGGPVASPLTVVDLLYSAPLHPLRDRVGEAVGLFGAIEIRFHGAPVLLDEAYEVDGEIVAISDSPQTEVLWYDARAVDQSGALVATLRMMNRFFKASSPRYAEG